MIDLLVYAERSPEKGQTVTGERLTIGHGGKGANQAVMAARLGAEVTFVTRVGNDVFGEMARASLAEQGLDLSRVKRVPGQSTGVASIWIEPDGTNRILIVPGANGALSPEDVAGDLAEVAPADCIVCQLEVSSEAARAALRWGRTSGAITILNPAPATPLDREMLELVDWLIPNETEFWDLFGGEPTDGRLVEVASALAGGLIVTLGDDGAATVVDGHVVRVPPPRAATIDTTGAGDAFVGALAYSLSMETPLDAAITFANRCGALSTTRFGTQSSFPDAAELLLEGAPSEA